MDKLQYADCFEVRVLHTLHIYNTLQKRHTRSLNGTHQYNIFFDKAEKPKKNKKKDMRKSQRQWGGGCQGCGSFFWQGWYVGWQKNECTRRAWP